MSGIGKSFSGAVALSGVNFELRAGETHILAGENGAGKSTLIKIICGVHTEYDGTVELMGESIRLSSPQDAAIHGITAIHQELSLIASMSVADNIFLAREKLGKMRVVNFREEKRHAGEILKKLGLDIDVSLPVEDFPISVQQLIEIAKALSIDAKIIIMDEPTSSLTEPEAARLFDTISSLKSQGRTVVYITHKMEEIYKIADRITVLRDGKFIGTAEASDLPQAKLTMWMVGREIGEHFPKRQFESHEESLRVENLTLCSSDKKRKFVDDVSFSARRGEILGIAGLQGSGASELLNAIFGSYGKIENGKVYLNKKQVQIISPKHSIKNRIALLTNDRKTTGLVLCMGIDKNITLASIDKHSPGYLLSPKREMASALKYSAEMNIRAADISLEVNSLSGGNQQKVALAKWLETEPEILLLDEPTRGIDIAAKHEIYELINRKTAAGATALLITSEMPELLALSDRIIVMHRGKITGEFSRANASQEKILEAAMGQTM